MIMKSMQSYRHVIDLKTKEIFVNCLKKIVKEIDMEKIGFVGVIDSKKEFSHDIDVLIFPSKNARIGESFFFCYEIISEVGERVKEKT